MGLNMIINRSVLGLVISITVFSTVPARSADFKFRKSVALKIGQSVILKGVRSRDCGAVAPGWSRVRHRLPKTKLGIFSDGGAGFTRSKHCGGRVGARGIRFTAKRAGNEQVTIFEDTVRITVN